MLRSAAILLLLSGAAMEAQTVTFSACNAGTAAVEVFFAQGSNLVTKQVAPADCATLAESTGPMAPGLVAVAFANAKGQWGGVHRMERVPGFGSGVVERTSQTFTVLRGTIRASLPAQFNFKPPKPNCVTSTYREPIPGGGSVAKSSTRCDDFDYTLNVLAFPETREVSFLKYCASCDQKREAQKTDHQRATDKQADDAARALNRLIVSSGSLNIPVVGGVAVARAKMSREESQERYRENQEYDPTYWDRIGWSDVPRYGREVFSNQDMQGSAAVLQGTISGVKLPNPGAEQPWTDVYFREAPNREMILCATGPDILSDIFGPNFATSMIGKTVEVEGLVAHCLSGTGILIKLQHQIKLVGNAPGMVPGVIPPPFKFPEDPNRRYVVEPTGPPAAPPRQYDPFAPNWDINTETAIAGFCGDMYNPRIMLNEPFASAKNQRGPEIAAEAAACKSKFNAEDLRANRQATLHYCLTHFDYYAPTGRVELFDACFKQNDALFAMCTHREGYLNRISKYPVGVLCVVPHPVPAEIARVKTGGNSNGPPLPIPAKAPGIPPGLLATLTSLDPGIVRSAGPLPEPPKQTQSSPAQPSPAAPATAPPRATVPATVRPSPNAVQQRNACMQAALKRYPQAGQLLADAIVACNQVK